MNRKVLEIAIDGILSSHGFKKKRSTWYRQATDALQGVDLQKSTYGGQFYVNLCFVPAGMVVEGMPTPKEHKCPVRIRLDSAFPESKKRIEELFDLERMVAEAQRTTGIQDIFGRLLIPFLDQLYAPSDFRTAIERGVFRGGAVTIAARQHFGIRA
ncbi:MAG TPA: DUF4304 domain-containing protein [Dongiaceae bacterium]|jgi:hypothetical protein